MKTLVATALLAYAHADETSLMQDLVTRSSSSKLSATADASKAGRHASTSKLLETAVKMIKNGVTPDVETFIDETNAEIEDEVLVAIQREHDIDQTYIDDLAARFAAAVAALQEKLLESEQYEDNWNAASETHQLCRAEEAFACARSRKCEEDLRLLWKAVKTAEEEMRAIHAEIHHEWCIDPVTNPSIADCPNSPPYHLDAINSGHYGSGFLPESPHVLNRCFNWERQSESVYSDWGTSAYPLLDLPQDVTDFRNLAVTHFATYIHRKSIVEAAWEAYNSKIVVCGDLEERLAAKSPDCDTDQTTMRNLACAAATHSRFTRSSFGEEWHLLQAEFAQARRDKDIMQMDRIAEWETLKIVQCILDHVHSNVERSIIDPTMPCPTIESDPEGVTLAIEDCHVVTRGCEYAWTQPFDRDDDVDRGTSSGNVGTHISDATEIFTDIEGNSGTWPISSTSLTSHLCLRWYEIPPPPPPPPPFEGPCTPEYIAMEQGSFYSHIQVQYEASIGSEEGLDSHLTGLADSRWAGCAAPLVCIDCQGIAVTPVNTGDSDESETCKLHQLYLAPGASDADTFRCSDGSCLSMSGRCNGHSQCGDGSDEQGCNTHHGAPEYLGEALSCEISSFESQHWEHVRYGLVNADDRFTEFMSDVHYRCANGMCIEKVGLCNGIDNCGDGSDEQACSGAVSVAVEATSGRTVTVETLSTTTDVFHDRQYQFDSLGYFAGKTFIKYSNDDKWIDHQHVMTKIRTEEPLTVHIVKLPNHQLPWLATQGYSQSAHAGLSFHGSRTINRGDRATEWEDTRPKEWENGINVWPAGGVTENINTDDHYAFSQVYSKTFPAGTISIPGNDQMPGNAGIDHLQYGVDGSFLIFLEKPSVCAAAQNSVQDQGYNDVYRGWYDVQGCGECNDYCRWVGNSGSGGDPAVNFAAGSSDNGNNPSWWSCRMAGSDATYSARGIFTSFNFAKC